ncbi:hypothetical protein ACM3AR_005532, partial [Escherichia coli]
AELLSAAVAENTPIARGARIVHDRYFNFIGVLHLSFILVFMQPDITVFLYFIFSGATYSLVVGYFYNIFTPVS